MNTSFPTAARWFAVCAIPVLCTTTQANAADLTVQVKNLRPTPGLVVGALYDSAGSFLKPNGQSQAQVTPTQGSEVKLVFKNLAPGRYALTTFQDENGNTKLDMNALGSPIEAVGFSKDAMGQAAPPSFDQAAIDVTGDTAITINLH